MESTGEARGPWHGDAVYEKIQKGLTRCLDRVQFQADEFLGYLRHQHSSGLQLPVYIQRYSRLGLRHKDCWLSSPVRVRSSVHLQKDQHKFGCKRKQDEGTVTRSIENIDIHLVLFNKL